VSAPAPDATEALVDELRALLLRVDYSRRGLARLTGVTDPEHGPGADPRAVVAALEAGGPLGTLGRTLWLGLPIAVSTLAPAIAPMTVDAWQAAGLIERRGERVRARVFLLPWADLWLFADRPVPIDRAPPDHVMGLGGGTEVLRALMIKTDGARVLDLGAGSGALSLLAAASARQVDGIELNSRAVTFAKLNARLNGASNCRFMEGDYFAPAAALEGYDLVLGQPPFVISPSRGVLFRDAGRGDDDIWRYVRVAARALADGGIAQLLINWIQRRGGDPFDGPAEATSDLDCDAFVAWSRIEPTAVYARAWVSDPAEIEAWIRHYDELGVEAICSGPVVLRRRKGATCWRHFTQVPETMSAGAGEHVVQILDGVHRLQTSTENDLLSLCPRTRGGLDIGDAAIRSTTGLHYRVPPDPDTVSLLQACDGTKSLSRIADDLAAQAGRSGEEQRTRILTVARTLLGQGLLLP